MEMAAGESLVQVISGDSGSQSKVDSVVHVAEALHAIHDLTDAELPRRKLSMSSALDHVRQRLARVHIVAPEIAEEADSLLRTIERRMVSSGKSSATCFLHGDFKASQVLIDGRRVAIIDLDSAAQGDAALDVGNFISDLHRLAAFGGNTEARALANDFLDAYAARSGDAGLFERAKLYRCLALVRMAAHSFRQFAHTFQEPGPWRPLLLLQEARACLEPL